MTHTHHKWPCPKSNGRHEWEWDFDKLNKVGIDKWMKLSVNKEYKKLGDIGIPVRCIYGCGAWGTEWYEFKELIEGG